MKANTILQFGTGRFLRSFVDLFVEEANTSASRTTQVVAIQSTGEERARQLRTGAFHVAVRGLSDGDRVDRTTAVTCVADALAADTAWPKVLMAARNPGLRAVVSNTTEAGLALDAADSKSPGDGEAPRSFPAKLLATLLARADDDLPGVTIAPCELVDGNATVLRDLVSEQASRWGIEKGRAERAIARNAWCDTLVDRIVSAPRDDDPMLAGDALFSVAEPFALWAVASPDRVPVEHRAVQRVDDVAPYALRKVRILNGAHTALVARCLGTFTTVREAMADGPTRSWLEGLVLDEIVPTLAGRVDGAEAFANEVFDRFANPFLDHRLADIALHQEEKVRVRLMPTYEAYRAQFGRAPRMIGEVLSGYV